MSAAPCRFREPPDVVMRGENSHGRYAEVGGGTVLLHRYGHEVCLTCGAHTATGGQGCDRIAAVRDHARQAQSAA